MTARVYRLTEIHQRIDAALGLARSRRDGAATQRMLRLRHRVKRLLRRVMSGRPR